MLTPSYRSTYVLTYMAATMTDVMKHPDPLLATCYKPPATFSHTKQCEKELEARKVLSTTVYGLQWSPFSGEGEGVGEEQGGRYLVACSSFGVICIWDILGNKEEDEGDDDDDETMEDNGMDSMSSSVTNKRQRIIRRKRRTESCLSRDYWKDNVINKSNPIVRYAMSYSFGAYFSRGFSRCNIIPAHTVRFLFD